MGDAWSTIVVRESEWDDYTRAEARADVRYRSITCPTCGRSDGLTPVPKYDRGYVWSPTQEWLVKAFRCITCAAHDLTERDRKRALEKVEYEPRVAHPLDGLRFVVTDPDPQ